MDNKALKGISLILFGILLTISSGELNGTVFHGFSYIPFAFFGVISGVVGLVFIFAKGKGCMPSLGMMTINALTASDSVIIPCQPHYLSARGLEQLSHTIAKVKRYMNPDLRIEGILLTMVDNRGKFVKEISSLLRSQYGESINIYKSEIPLSVRAAESSAEGRSIYAHDKFGKVANAYKELTKEVIHGAENKRRKNKAENVR